MKFNEVKEHTREYTHINSLQNPRECCTVSSEKSRSDYEHAECVGSGRGWERTKAEVFINAIIIEMLTGKSRSVVLTLGSYIIVVTLDMAAAHNSFSRACEDGRSSYTSATQGFRLATVVDRQGRWRR